VSNHVYQFSFAASFGDDLLRQVQAVTVRVELLRCTWGQYMTVRAACLAVSTFCAIVGSVWLILADVPMHMEAEHDGEGQGGCVCWSSCHY
jgi:hypothetical protein